MEVEFKKDVQEIYSYFNKENYLDLVDYNAIKGPLLEECTEVALKSWNALNCLDGGRVDLRVDKHGRVSFIEVNPLAGLNPLSSDLPILCKLNGISYHVLMGLILDAAIKRNFGFK
jgi:D-alanine-D-alanine ligase